jgi:hypothetical protein
VARVPITVMGYRCERCQHEWLPRSAGEPSICPKCKSANWNRPRTKAMMCFDDFKTIIDRTLREAGRSLTWTELRTIAKLPQAFPNNKWVRQLEREIGLERKRDKAGIIRWQVR